VLTRAVLLVALWGWPGLWPGQIAAQGYQGFKDPDYELAVFDQDAVSLQGVERNEVVEALAALASNFPANGLVDMDLREKALAIALRLDSLNGSARAARQALMEGQSPEPSEFFQDLPSISRSLWSHAEAMKKGQDPADEHLYPLLMELALVVVPNAPPMAEAVYADSVGKLGDKVPEWKSFVAIEGGEKSSSERAARILERGRGLLGKIVAALESKEKKGKRPNTGLASTPPGNAETASPSMPEPVDPDPADEQGDGKVLRPSAEVHVVRWWRRRGSPVRLGKVILNIREPTPEDAPLFENGKGNPPSVMGMRLKPPAEAELSSGWVSYLYFAARNRNRPWPRGKVGVIDVQLIAGQEALPEAMPLAGGGIIGTVLALETTLAGVEMDPATVVFGSLNSKLQVSAAYGSMAEAVKLAREAGYRLIVVSSEAETQVRDWIALGDLDRLVHPQMLMAANVDELVAATRIDRAAEVDEAIQLFSEVEELTNKMTLEEAARNEVVQQRLEAIVDQFPQHLSAKMLLAYGKNGDGLVASVAGSYRSISEVIEPFEVRYNTAMNEDGGDAADVQELGNKAGERLKYLGARVNGETKKFLDLSEKLLGSFVSYLRLSNKTSTSAIRRRGDVDEDFQEWIQERNRLVELIREEERKQQGDDNGQ
jgi:hypothetical protein